MSVDYYDKQTSNLLYQAQMPKETGWTTTTRNVGAMQNRGFEFLINARVINKKDWKWNFSFNIATNNSIIKKLADNTPFFVGSSNIYVQEGRRIGEFYGYRYGGIFQYDESNAFTPDWQQLMPVFENGLFQNQYLLNGKTYTGEVKQKVYISDETTVFQGGDINWLEAPGHEDGVIDEHDRVVLGCAQPDYYGGLNSTLTWKGLSLFVSVYYSMGGQIYNLAKKTRNAFQRTFTTPDIEAIYNMWTQPGDIATYPAPLDRPHNRLGPTDFYLEDASYIKLRNVKLTYRLPKEITGKIYLKSVDLYVYANNLLTFTAYKGFDPELPTSDALSFNIDNNRYPRKKEFGFGINVNF